METAQLPTIIPDANLSGGSPAVSGSGRPVADFIRTAYGEGPEEAGKLRDPPLSDEEFRKVLNYCADEACDSDRLFCPGCRKRTDAEGIQSLDQYCRRFSSVTFAESGLKLDT